MIRLIFIFILSAFLAGLACEKDSTIGPVDNNSAYTDLTVNIFGMTPVIGHPAVFDVRTVSSSLVARGILDPIGNATVTFKMPGALPPGSNENLDFYSDLNDNGTYDAPPIDHAWRVAIPANGVVNFTHNTSFTDIGTLAGLFNFEMNFDAAFGVHGTGKLVELRVADSLTGQTVGLYRKGIFGSGVQQIIIPGVLRSNRTYRIDFYADQNGNSKYEAPPTDHAWRLYGHTPDNLQLTIDFVTNTTYTDVKF